MERLGERIRQRPAVLGYLIIEPVYQGGRELVRMVGTLQKKLRKKHPAGRKHGRETGDITDLDFTVDGTDEQFFRIEEKIL